MSAIGLTVCDDPRLKLLHTGCNEDHFVILQGVVVVAFLVSYTALVDSLCCGKSQQSF